VIGTRVPGGTPRLSRDLVRLAHEAARRAGRDVDLSFAVLSDAGMRALHRRSLGHDVTTDVLAFPLEEEPVLRGDVVCSADTARREAAGRGHAPYHELMLYAVHGTLHLLGHDDHAPRPRARMRRAEREVLAALGLPAVFGRRDGRAR
jgi:probable rRNA maturation factor